jgi:exodeoxyribonuclease V gamma subunit
MAGGQLQDCVNAELARGTLPPAMLAPPVLDDVTPVVAMLAAEAQRHGGDGPSLSLDVNLRLPDGRTLAGTVPGVHGNTIRRTSYSRVRARDRLAAWVRLLALTVHEPQRPFEAVVIGRRREGGAHGAEMTVSRIPRLAPDTALAQLLVLVDLYDRGMREPLPLACETSAAYAQAVAAGADGEAAARDAWETAFRFDKEDRQPEHVLVFGEAVPFGQLLEEAPRDDERGDGWAERETTRFGRYACRLWEGLLSHEEISER